MCRFIGIMRDWSFIISSLSRRVTFFIQCLPPICNGLTMFCLTVCICFLSLFLCLFHAIFKITGRFFNLFFSLLHCILSSSRYIPQLFFAVIYIRTELTFCTYHFPCYLTHFLA